MHPQRGACFNRLMFKRVLLLIGTLVVVASTVFGLITYYSIRTAIADDELLLNEERSAERRVNDALLTLPLSADEMLNGFWYSIVNPDGTESVGFIDPKELVRLGLSEEEIAKIISRLRGGEFTPRKDMAVVADAKLPKWAKFHNNLYSFSGPGVFQKTQSDLEKRVATGSATSEELTNLAYLYQLKGEYAKQKKLDLENCKRFKVNCVADEGVITLLGLVKDMQGIPVAGAKVTVLGDEAITAKTDETGRYTVIVKVHPPEKIRIHATKRNFSDGVSSVVVSPGMVKKLSVPDVVLSSPITVITINTKTGAVTGKDNSHLPDGSFIVKSPLATYKIPPQGIVTATGEVYSGVVDIYLYEFDNDTIPSSLANIDTFDQVMGYAGNLMKSFGMPYIQFFTPEGVELHVQKKKPMILTYRIANMDDLRTDKAKIYGPLTDADVELLIASSTKEGEYTIDRKWIIDHDMLRFPPFWVFDRKRGVWESVGIRVLDTNGTIEAPFYTLNQ